MFVTSPFWNRVKQRASDAASGSAVAPRGDAPPTGTESESGHGGGPFGIRAPARGTESESESVATWIPAIGADRDGDLAGLVPVSATATADGVTPAPARGEHRVAVRRFHRRRHYRPTAILHIDPKGDTDVQA